MAAWADFLTDAAMLYAIFGDELPTLRKVDLHEILLHRDGPKVSFRFDLPSYPKNPPKKWGDSGFDRVQLKLMAFGVRNFSIEGWRSESKCNIFVFSNGQSIGLQIEGGGGRVSLDTDHLLIDGISAYRSQ